MKSFFANLRSAASMMAAMTLLFGFGYPLAMTGIAQAMFPVQANGSLVVRGGTVVGSALLGQSFEDPRYLIGRPSAVGYDAANSGGSNLGPSSRNLIEAVAGRVRKVRAIDGIDVPSVDRVTASASGLDPHLWRESALEQVDRIARLRGADRGKVREIVEAHEEGAYLGFLGESVVNVLLVNLALDEAFPPKTWPARDGLSQTEVPEGNE